MLIVDGATATVEKYGRQAEPMSQIQDWRCLESHEVVVVGRGRYTRVDMLIVVVGAQGQFKWSCVPIDGVSEAQQHVSGTCRMAVPVALHAGVQEEVLLLIGIAQHPLVN